MVEAVIKSMKGSRVIEGMNGSRRKIALVAMDAILVNLALMAALWLRFDGTIPPDHIWWGKVLVIPFIVVYLLSSSLFGLYGRLWRYASTDEGLAIIEAVSVGTVINAIITYLAGAVTHVLPLPRTIFPLLWILIMLFMASVRFGYRVMRDYSKTHTKSASQKDEVHPTLIVGAGDAAVAVLRELKGNPEAKMRPVVLVDDDITKQKHRLHGVPVAGKCEDIPRLVEQHHIKDIIIAMPSAPGQVIRGIVELCRGTPARLRTLPSIYELLDGKITVNRLREVRIEDLLGREPVTMDINSARYLNGKTVLVTGAGGSIGSELCRQIAQLKPRRLVLVGHGENSIHNIYMELSNRNRDLSIVQTICSVCDRASMEGVMAAHRPQVVFHVAAHKHVPLMEDNPGEALRNNVLGTWNAAWAARQTGAETFIMISTDKAVNPTSIMGATKRVAELVVQKVAKGAETKFAVVRFGNVLGSRGSVVPLFKEQIARGGPVSVTHPAMTRYFMTIPEAAQLILQAGGLADSKKIFILDMGEPVRITELAETMIRLSGYEPGKDIEIVYTGVRPGEKLHEQLFTPEEKQETTINKRIFVTPMNGLRKVDTGLEELLKCLLQPGFYEDSREEVERLLRLVLPDFGLEEGIASTELCQ